MAFDFNFDISSLIKLFNKGKIDKTYEKMYRLAEDITVHETEQFMSELRSKAKEDEINKIPQNKFDYASKVWNYRKERLEFHMNKMMELLKLNLKENSDK